MRIDPAVRPLLPADGAEWVPISRGESGAMVLHDPDAGRYAKIAVGAAAEELAAERDRIAWLDAAGLPGAGVLDWRTTDDGACLITSGVPGVAADQLGSHALRRAWPAIADTLRALHDLPVAGCPFDRGIDSMVALARANVAGNRVQVEFLPEGLQQVPPRAILAEIENQLPQRREEEASSRVVCHGDFCLPNILIDPETSRVSGLIDLGRLGAADPYADIALLLANARETWPDEDTAKDADREFAAGYRIDLDAERQRFHLLLDPLTWAG